MHEHVGGCQAVAVGSLLGGILPVHLGSGLVYGHGGTGLGRHGRNLPSGALSSWIEQYLSFCALAAVAVSSVMVVGAAVTGPARATRNAERDEWCLMNSLSQKTFHY
ncbi:MAG TPA: hypothetical protein VNO31_03155 [Umezawaea sp.]|nr:hypothetical protein [Umezawaea sp.]